MDQHGNPNSLGHQLVQKCQPLRGHVVREKIDPRQVSARPGEAGDKTELDRIFADAEDDRDLCGRSFGCKRSEVAGWRGDNGDATTHEVSHDRRKAIELPLQPVVLHRYVLALDVAGFVEAVPKSGGKGRIGRSGIDKPDNWHRRLLRTHGERPRNRCTAQKRNEIAPPHASPRGSDTASYRLKLAA